MSHNIITFHNGEITAYDSLVCLIVEGRKVYLMTSLPPYINYQNQSKTIQTYVECNAGLANVTEAVAIRPIR
jgi:hypothetical protein